MEQIRRFSYKNLRPIFETFAKHKIVKTIGSIVLSYPVLAESRLPKYKKHPDHQYLLLISSITYRFHHISKISEEIERLLVFAWNLMSFSYFWHFMPFFLTLAVNHSWASCFFMQFKTMCTALQMVFICSFDEKISSFLS